MVIILVVIVAVGDIARKCGCDDHGAGHADDAHNIVENAIVPSVLRRLINRLGEAVVGHARPVLMNAIVASRGE